MIRKLTFLLIILLQINPFWSCRKADKSIQTDVISEKKMVEVLMDVQMLEAYLRRMETQGKVHKNQSVKLFTDLFKKHQVSQEEFNYSMTWYSQRPEILHEIQEEVVNQLVTLESEVTTQKHVKHKGE
jgi:hypothetical protein